MVIILHSTLQHRTKHQLAFFLFFMTAFFLDSLLGSKYHCTLSWFPQLNKLMMVTMHKRKYQAYLNLQPCVLPVPQVCSFPPPSPETILLCVTLQLLWCLVPLAGHLSLWDNAYLPVLIEVWLGTDSTGWCILLLHGCIKPRYKKYSYDFKQCFTL